MRRAIQGSLVSIGLTLLFFAAAAWAATRRPGFFVIANAALGAAALVAWSLWGRGAPAAFPGGRSARYGANVAVSSALFLGLLLMINFVATRYEVRYDATEARVFGLSPQTESVLRGLEDELELVAFVEGRPGQGLRDLLESYAYVSPKVSYRFVDPARRPDVAGDVTTYDTVRVAYEDRSTLVTRPGEEGITNAILKVARKDRKTLCFVHGHGEPDPDDETTPRGYAAFRQALENESHEVRKIVLPAEETAPGGGCDLLVVSGGTRPWLERELDALRSWLERGGRGIFLLPAAAGAELAPILEPYGVRLGDNIVIDRTIRPFGAPTLGIEPIVDNYTTHPITDGFRERTIFARARSVDPARETPEGTQAAPFARTGAASWAETDLEAVFGRGYADFDPDADRQGPVTIAVAVTRETAGIPESDEEQRLVVIGSDEFVANRMFHSLFNRDFAINAANWTLGEEDLISIRPRGMRPSRIRLTEDQVTQIFFLSVLVIPELLLLAGIVVSARRRFR